MGQKNLFFHCKNIPQAAAASKPLPKNNNCRCRRCVKKPHLSAPRLPIQPFAQKIIHLDFFCFIALIVNGNVYFFEIYFLKNGFSQFNFLSTFLNAAALTA